MKGLASPRLFAETHGRLTEILPFSKDEITQDEMAIALGKRKRQTEAPKSLKKVVPIPKPVPIAKAEESESEGEDLQAIFQRAFEAKFKPLDGVAKKKAEKVEEAEVDEEEDDDAAAQDSDWDGISEADNDIEVIEHADIKRIPKDELDKKEMKAFMVLSLIYNVPVL